MSEPTWQEVAEARMVTIERLRAALRAVMAETGTSTLAHHHARDALGAGADAKEGDVSDDDLSHYMAAAGRLRAANEGLETLIEVVRQEHRDTRAERDRLRDVVEAARDLLAGTDPWGTEGFILVSTPKLTALRELVELDRSANMGGRRGWDGTTCGRDVLGFPCTLSADHGGPCVSTGVSPVGNIEAMEDPYGAGHQDEATPGG